MQSITATHLPSSKKPCSKSTMLDKLIANSPFWRRLSSLKDWPWKVISPHFIGSVSFSEAPFDPSFTTPIRFGADSRRVVLQWITLGGGFLLLKSWRDKIPSGSISLTLQSYTCVDADFPGPPMCRCMDLSAHVPHKASCDGMRQANSTCREHPCVRQRI